MSSRASATSSPGTAPERYGLPLGGDCPRRRLPAVGVHQPSLHRRCPRPPASPSNHRRPGSSSDAPGPVLPTVATSTATANPTPASALAWGADPEGVGDSIFLARAAAAALHPDQYAFLLDSETTEPRVASPPFVATLEALVRAPGFRARPDAKTFDAQTAPRRVPVGQGPRCWSIAPEMAQHLGGPGKTPIGVCPPCPARLAYSTRAGSPGRPPSIPEPAELPPRWRRAGS